MFISADSYFISAHFRGLVLRLLLSFRSLSLSLLFLLLLLPLLLRLSSVATDPIRFLTCRYTRTISPTHRIIRALSEMSLQSSWRLAVRLAIALMLIRTSRGKIKIFVTWVHADLRVSTRLPFLYNV